MAEPLDGAWAKLKRAKKHLDDFKAEVAQFLDPHLYEVASYIDADTGKERIRYTGPEPPLEFSVIVGEIAHQLRSSLDHVLWALLPASDRALPHANNFEFPIIGKLTNAKTAADYESNVTRKIGRNIHSGAAAIIRSEQPYLRGDPGYQSSLLWKVYELDCVDKHRLLHVIVTHMELSGWRKVITEGPDGLQTGMEITFGYATLKRGERHADFVDVDSDEWRPDVDMQTQFSSRVAFEQLGLEREVDVLDTLDKVFGYTVRLVDKFKNPEFFR